MKRNFPYAQRIESSKRKGHKVITLAWSQSTYQPHTMSNSTESHERYEITADGMLLSFLIPLGFTAFFVALLWLINGRSFMFWQLSADTPARLATIKTRPRITYQTQSEIHINTQFHPIFLWILGLSFPIIGIITMILTSDNRLWLLFPILFTCAGVIWALVCARADTYKLRSFGSHMAIVDRYLTLMGIVVKKMENIPVKGCELATKYEKSESNYYAMVCCLLLHVDHETNSWEISRCPKEYLEPAYKALLSIAGEYTTSTNTYVSESMVWATNMWA